MVFRAVYIVQHVSKRNSVLHEEHVLQAVFGHR